MNHFLLISWSPVPNEIQTSTATPSNRTQIKLSSPDRLAVA